MPSLVRRLALGAAAAAVAAGLAAGCGGGGDAPGGGGGTTPAATAPADPAAALEARAVPAGLADGVRLGRADAPMVIEMYADFGCPHCLEFTVNVEPRLVEEYVVTGKAALVYRFLPLRDLTAGPAIAAWCAAQQNRFWEYHNLLFAAQARAANGGRPSLGESFIYDGLRAMAERAGLDMAAWEACIGTSAPVDAIVADMAEASKLGINGTPTFVIDGAVYQNPGTWAEWQKVLAQAGR
jgi:protein-disulfide isomerase